MKSLLCALSLLSLSTYASTYTCYVSIQPAPMYVSASSTPITLSLGESKVVKVDFSERFVRLSLREIKDGLLSGDVAVTAWVSTDEDVSAAHNDGFIAGIVSQSQKVFELQPGSKDGLYSHISCGKIK